MKITNFFIILFENIIFFVIILTLFNFSINSKINKANEVKLNND